MTKFSLKGDPAHKPSDDQVWKKPHSSAVSKCNYLLQLKTACRGGKVKPEPLYEMWVCPLHSSFPPSSPVGAHNVSIPTTPDFSIYAGEGLGVPPSQSQRAWLLPCSVLIAEDFLGSHGPHSQLCWPCCAPEGGTTRTGLSLSGIKLVPSTTITRTSSRQASLFYGRCWVPLQLPIPRNLS